MSNRRSIAQIYIEGSSTAYGLGDELGRGGFAGRLAYHYTQYSEQAKDGVRQSPFSWVFTYQHAKLNAGLGHIVEHLPSHIGEAHVNARRLDSIRRIGIFVIGKRPEYELRTYSADQVYRSWRNNFDDLEQLCGDYAIEPIFLLTPEVDHIKPLPPDLSIDHELRHKMMRVTLGRVASMEAPLMSFEESIDYAEDCIAPDGIHGNARAYDKIYRKLVPLIDERLSIDTTDLLTHEPRMVSYQ